MSVRAFSRSVAASNTGGMPGSSKTAVWRSITRSARRRFTRISSSGGPLRSLNEEVCPLQQGARNREAERSGRLQIDRQLELGRLLHRKVRRSRALEDPVDVGGGATEQIATVSTIGPEATSIHKLSESVDGREPAHRREVQDPGSVGERQGVFHCNQSVHLPHECFLERL